MTVTLYRYVVGALQPADQIVIAAAAVLLIACGVARLLVWCAE